MHVFIAISLYPSASIAPACNNNQNDTPHQIHLGLKYSVISSSTESITRFNLLFFSWHISSNVEHFQWVVDSCYIIIQIILQLQFFFICVVLQHFNWIKQSVTKILLILTK